MPEIAAIPMCRPENRGVILLRGSVLPLIDLRKRFGWKSVPEELDDFYKLMNQREEDHRNWLRELERSVTEGTEFRLATDPHKCAFGKWFYSYRPESPWIATLLRKFEGPHNRIHGIAAATGELVRAGKAAEARRLIEEKRGRELRQMTALFQELKDLMRDTARELAIVVTGGQAPFAVSIDHALAVETIGPERIEEVPTDVLGEGWVSRTAQRSGGETAMILDPAMLRGERALRESAG